MSSRSSPHRLVLHARRLVSLGAADEILTASCREVMALTGADRAFAACCLPGRAWEQGLQLEVAHGEAKRASTAARSALFAIHRRLSSAVTTRVLERTDETASIFRGLACGADIARIDVVPIVHRTGRVWGELVLVGATAIDADGVSELAELATSALENAHRLAFARQDQDRLLLLAEATSDALYDWNLDTRELWWGGGVLKVLGSGSEPVHNTLAWKLARIHADDRARVTASLDDARLGHASTWQAEYRFVRSDGSSVFVEDRGYFMRDTEARAYRMIGSMRDVTAIKELLVREQAARQSAEAANRAKDEFLAMLGHELRNPLAPIVTGLQLVRLRGTLDLEKDLTVLERQAQHLIRLVDDLLDISRITHGKIELKKARVEIAAVIASALEIASPLIEGRRHHLQLDAPSLGLEVEADSARLAQAISNLLANAAKYTEPGGAITVTARRDGDAIVIAIRDSGIGIEPEMLPKVFDMFVQERQALDRAQGGLGLGLSIVRNLVEMHGGTVVPSSAGRGRGSEFTIRIPAACPAIASARAVRPAVPRRPATGRKIVVVDDNEDAADLLSALLERLGNTTRVAHDGSSALRLIDEFEPDLAVLDIGLPVMDGYELARRLREIRRTKTLRLVALTGYGQAADRARATEAGFDAHLVKPIALDALEAVISRLDAS